METGVIPSSPIEMSSAEDVEDDTEENDNNTSKEMETQEPQSTEVELSSPS